jgi:hypothetical protein
MSFKIKETETMKLKREKYLSHVRPEILELANREEPLSREDIKDIRCNSYELELILGNCNKETLLHYLVYYYNNSGLTHKARQKYDNLPSHYGEALEATILPLLTNILEKEGYGKLSIVK